MSKKVKCCECASFLGWALPERVDKDNYEYAKRAFKSYPRWGQCLDGKEVWKAQQGYMETNVT